MPEYIVDELKPLYANIIRLGSFGEYLRSENFKLLLIEKRLDSIWDSSLEKIIEIEGTSAIFPGYYGGYKFAFSLFLNHYYTDERFIEYLVSILNAYQIWINRTTDFSEIIISLESIGKYNINFEDLIQRFAFSPQMVQKKQPLLCDKIFIVHGHEEIIREKVARFLELLELKPIILTEKSNEGLTIIEKVEKYSDEASYAIILFTPDDEGKKIGDENLHSRARQNVILEYGYFIGKLGRNRVCVLNGGVTDIPSDMGGLAYHDIDDAGGWKVNLATELYDAGFVIDMNKLIKK